MKISKTIEIDPELESHFRTVYDRIQGASRIAICGHINPDGDDLGSQLALYEFLNEKISDSSEQKFYLLTEEEIPDSLSFLPNCDHFTNIKNQPLDIEFDLMIVVDSGDLERIGIVKNYIGNHTFVINIDHHIGNTRFGDINVIIPWASSVGELLYYFFVINEIDLNHNMATDLYVSISSDTGSFRYDQMHSAVHLIIADLMDRGVIPFEMNRYMNQSFPRSFLELLSLSLSRLEYYHNGKIAMTHLLNHDFEKIGDDNTDGLIEYYGKVESVSVYILIKEKEKGFFSASLRSKFDVNVAEIAQKFNGGGHLRAAGCRVRDMSYDVFKNELVQEIEKQL